MRLLLAVLALTTVMIAAAVPAAAAPRYERCRDVILRTGDGSVYTRTNGLWASRVRCRKARKVARRYLHGSEGNAGAAPRPFGFRCSGGEDGVACRKGHRRVTWGYYYD